MSANTSCGTVEVMPGDELHLTMLMAPMSLNFLVASDRQDLLAYAKSVWQESRKHALADAKQTNVTCQIYGHVVGACVECNTHIEKAPTIVPMTDGEITMTGHRIASKYTHRSDPTSHSYGFVKNTLIAFVREVEAHHGIK